MESLFTSNRLSFKEFTLEDAPLAPHTENLASQRVLIKLGFQYKDKEVVDDAPAYTYLIHP